MSIVHRLSEADYIIALDNSGEIDEKGTFDCLINTDGYTSSLGLKRRIPQISTKENKLVNFLQGALPASASKEASDTGKAPAGDMTVYKYYIETFGWGNWAIFTSACVVYGFGTAFPSTISQHLNRLGRISH